jgi:hypothetical protein
MTVPNEYKTSLSNAIAFKHEHPEETATTAAQIYHVNDETVQTTLLQEKKQRKGPAPKHRGHNKILSKVQVKAIYKYVEDLYLSRYGATKAMVFATVSCLKAHELLPKMTPSYRWFQGFMKDYPELFKTLKTKPIALVRVTAADYKEVKDWFRSFREFCEKINVQPGNILNFDEAGFWVKVALREEIIVLAYVKEVS